VVPALPQSAIHELRSIPRLLDPKKVPPVSGAGILAQLCECEPAPAGVVLDLGEEL
jgi:hypothetical protein